MVFFFAMVTVAFAPAFEQAAPTFAVAVAAVDDDAAATLRVPLPIVKFIS